MADRSFEPIITDGPWRGDLPTGLGLRTELSARSLQHALRHGYLHERTDGTVTLRRLADGAQRTVPFDDAVDRLRRLDDWPEAEA